MNEIVLVSSDTLYVNQKVPKQTTWQPRPIHTSLSERRYLNLLPSGLDRFTGCSRSVNAYFAKLKSNIFMYKKKRKRRNLGKMSRYGKVKGIK